MEITRTVDGDVAQLELSGRVDAYWSDHLNAEISEAVGQGAHHIRLDCARVSFLSSAGLGVLASFHQELEHINGRLEVVNPSGAVTAVLGATRIGRVLLSPGSAAIRDAADRRLTGAEAAFEIFDLDPGASLACRAIGAAAPLASSGFGGVAPTNLDAIATTFTVGVGAFGEAVADCQPRFGELLSVGGAIAYQPADGTNVADYLVAAGSLVAEVHVLYGLACDGRFSHLVRFDVVKPGTTVGLSAILAGCLDVVAADVMGIVVVAEAAGLVGAQLRRSPAQAAEGGFFSHPGVRTRLMFTAERAYGRSVALAAGIVARSHRTDPLQAEHLRPIGAASAGHLHAAAFRFHPIRKGRIDLGETVTGLFEPERLLGVMHLLSDDRGAGGAGESQFVRGACWIGPIAGAWARA